MVHTFLANGYTSGDGANKIINVYESSDLYNWVNKGAAFIFNCSEVNETDCYADRPKVLFNPSTKKFIMWMKSTPWTAIAIADFAIGPFQFHQKLDGTHR